MVRGRLRRVAFRLADVAAVLLVTGLAADDLGDRSIVEDALGLGALPASVRVTECKVSPVLTDYLVTCAIDFCPEALPALLAGRTWTREPGEGDSHTGVAEVVGQRFFVSARYSVRPREFRHGGHVALLVDGEQRRAVVDLYVE